MGISTMFEHIEREIQRKIDLCDGFRLTQYDTTDGLCYTVGEISKPIEFFQKESNKLFFIQKGNFCCFCELDKSKPFWAIEKNGNVEDFFKGKKVHEFHYFSAV